MISGGFIKPVIVAAASAALVALVGGLMTDLGPWYLSLRQPPWKPPDWAFGPIWTTIFALAAAAGVSSWRLGSRSQREWLLTLFSMNAFLNVFWSLLYFRLRRPDLALLEVVFLWLSVLLLIVVLWRYARTASWLLVPYFVWITVASVLNLETVRLNGPFG